MEIFSKKFDALMEKANKHKFCNYKTYDDYMILIGISVVKELIDNGLVDFGTHKNRINGIPFQIDYNNREVLEVWTKL